MFVSLSLSVKHITVYCTSCTQHNLAIKFLFPSTCVLFMCHELLFCFPELVFLSHPYFLLCLSHCLPLALTKFTHAYCIICWRVTADTGLLCFNLTGLRLFPQPFRQLNFISKREQFCIHSFGTKEIQQTSLSHC